MLLPHRRSNPLTPPTAKSNHDPASSIPQAMLLSASSPWKKNVHKVSLSPWKCFPGDAGGKAIGLLPCLQGQDEGTPSLSAMIPPSRQSGQWVRGPGWAPHGMDPCPHHSLPLRPGESLWISLPLLPSVSAEGRFSLFHSCAD